MGCSGEGVTTDNLSSMHHHISQRGTEQRTGTMDIHMYITIRHGINLHGTTNRFWMRKFKCPFCAFIRKKDNGRGTCSCSDVKDSPPFSARGYFRQMCPCRILYMTFYLHRLPLGICHLKSDVRWKPLHPCASFRIKTDVHASNRLRLRCLCCLRIVRHRYNIGILHVG